MNCTSCGVEVDHPCMDFGSGTTAEEIAKTTQKLCLNCTEVHLAKVMRIRHTPLFLTRAAKRAIEASRKAFDVYQAAGADPATPTKKLDELRDLCDHFNDEILRHVGRRVTKDPLFWRWIERTFS